MILSASSSDGSRRTRILALLVLLVAVMAQMVLWWNTRGLALRADGLREPPSIGEIDMLALGDRQFFFRSYALELQVGGDLGGRVTPLKDYDYDRLYRWFSLLDHADTRSNMVPTLAGYLYGNTPKVEGLRPIVQYLREHARADPERKWRFMAHAVWLAAHRLKDRALALEVAGELAALPARMPIWTRQMRAFILAEAGEKETARDILRVILATDPSLSPQERYFMERFIAERLE